jgi:hypothetical protein
MTTKIQKSHKKGAIVRLSSSGRDNDCYTHALDGRMLDSKMLITYVSTEYMPSEQFFNSGRPEGYHPGFDDCGFALYDLELLDGTQVPCSLYDWELEAA